MNTDLDEVWDTDEHSAHVAELQSMMALYRGWSLEEMREGSDDNA